MLLQEIKKLRILLNYLDKMKDILINNPNYFEYPFLDEVSKKFEFTQIRHLNLLIWDYELLSQLLSLNNNFILKGGAAAQIYLSDESQRASVDIDLATSLSFEETEKIIEKAIEKFLPYSEDKFFKITPLKPRAETKIIDGLKAFFISVPVRTGPNKEEVIVANLKLDILQYSEFPFKIKEIAKPKVFGYDFCGLKVISEGSLIADKILTLGDTTTGILQARDDYQGYFKQIYDLFHLTRSFINQSSVVSDSSYTFKTLTPIQLSYRQQNFELKDVFEDILRSLESKKYLDIQRDSEANKMRQTIQDLQGNYLNRKERVTNSSWCAHIGYLNLVFDLLFDLTLNKINDAYFKKAIEEIRKIEEKIDSLRGGEIKIAQTLLMNYFDADNKFRKELKNMPPKRIFYAVVKKENINKIAKELGG